MHPPRATALVALGILIAYGLTAEAADRKQAVEDPTFAVVSQVARMPAADSQLVVWTPTGVIRPWMTSNARSIRFACFTAEGRRLFLRRRPWPRLEQGDHFHLVVSDAVARRANRCRLNGIGKLLETDVAAWAEPRHPDSPAGHAREPLDPFRACGLPRSGSPWFSSSVGSSWEARSLSRPSQLSSWATTMRLRARSSITGCVPRRPS